MMRGDYFTREDREHLTEQIRGAVAAKAPAGRNVIAEIDGVTVLAQIGPTAWPDACVHAVSLGSTDPVARVYYVDENRDHLFRVVAYNGDPADIAAVILEALTTMPNNLTPQEPTE